MDQERLRDLLDNKQFRAFRQEIVRFDVSDIVRLMEELPAEQLVTAFRLLPKDLAVQIFDDLDVQNQHSLLESFTGANARAILEEMEPDERADLLEEVPAVVARRLLRLLSPEERQITLTLLGYEDGTAGRVMNPDFVDLRSEMNVEQALERIRQLSVKGETIYELYVIDNERHLLGTVSLKDLVLTSPNIYISDIVKLDPKIVFTNTHQEEVARILRDEELPAVSVVDNERRLVGIVTLEDVVDIVEEEATEDIYRFGAVPGTERGYFSARILGVARRRIVWLFLLILVNTITGTLIAGQERLLGEIVIMAAFIPLLIGTGGNVGAQSATVVIRGLATGEISARRYLSIVLREARVGVVLGIALGLVVLLWAYFLGRDLQVALVVSISLIAISIMATLVGGALPFIFRMIKIDPALVSAPVITTIMDVFGLGIYFLIAHLILQF
ncbi:MAG: magnesium transporter [Dehalococcoidales bacterium]|nr:magnesium transporter [Dehalococcoidales bacterium]